MNELVQVNNLSVMPVMNIQDAIQRRDSMVGFVKKIMVDGTDYGTIPGTDKPTLYKPGAEKLNTFFGLSPKFIIVTSVEDWSGEKDGEALFFYHYKCRLYRGNHLVGEGDGSCNSRESKYRWRWVSIEDVPSHLNPDDLKRRKSQIVEFAFAIDKAETGGQYGKPQEYWDEFRVAIAADEAIKTTKSTKSGKSFDAWAIESTVYRVPNEDIYSQINTIQKMAQKRALVAAVLVAVNASEFFTQDLEDFDLNTIDAEFTVTEQPKAQPESEKSSPEKTKAQKATRQPGTEQKGASAKANGGPTAFWTYVNENDIDKEAAKQVLSEAGNDFDRALSLLEGSADSIPQAA